MLTKEYQIKLPNIFFEDGLLAKNKEKICDFTTEVKKFIF
jgi:hypothetical protein